MPIQRLTGVAALVPMLLLATPSHATTHRVLKHHTQSRRSHVVAKASVDNHYSQVPGVLASPLSLNPWFALSPMPALASPNLAGFGGNAAPAFGVEHSVLAPVAAAPAVAEVAKATEGQAEGDADMQVDNISDLRKSLIDLAMNLRNVRYVRGGKSPSTGFDCSGFVRYVFAHAIGVQLPANSASQFLDGLKVNRADMKPGDLVFFHTGGRRHGGISHVGIYISNGQFIHAPTYGKRVQISSLDEAYWAKRFVGAKRPDGMLALTGGGNG
ncbi:C40 family peptidase [Rhodanobacter sp. 7MK24]|uniref:C40 family peptidase n=1 Tax=Rhodanobacter sp. 7MK24 TaxID=2775922 RepID=UPI0031BBB98A